MMIRNVFVCGGGRVVRRRFSTSRVAQEREILKRDSRQNINIGTLGTSLHGKTQLASTITKVLNKSYGVPIKEMKDIDNTNGEIKFGSSQQPTHIELCTGQYRYTLTDLPGHASYQRNMITHLSDLDVVFMVINPEEGVLKDMLDMYKVCQHLNIVTIPVLFKRKDSDSETVDLVLMELEDLGYNDSAMIVESLVSPPDQSVVSLFTNLEENIKSMNVCRDVHSKFVLPLQQVGLIPSRGTFCAGHVRSGKCKIGTTLEAFFNGQKSKGTVKDMEVFRKKTDLLQAGDRGGLFIKLKPDIDLKRGGVLYEPGVEGTVSSKWRVGLKTLQGQVKTKGEYVFFHSTFSDGKTTIEECDLDASSFTETNISVSSPVLASQGNKITLRSSNTTLVGTIIHPV